jgi:hypothetical protein
VGAHVGDELADLTFAAGELGRNGAQLVKRVEGVAFGLLCDVVYRGIDVTPSRSGLDREASRQAIS